MSAGQFARDEEGQALVIVALGMFALMAALAFTLDWGYGYAQRRSMQNAVDAATLAAGRHVATTFKLVGGAPAFAATIEEICDDVATRTAGVGGATEVSFFSDPTDPGTWTSVGTGACASGAGLPVPNDTIFVRVRSSATFRSLAQQTVAVAASARARLTGSAGCNGASCMGLRPLELPTGTEPGQGLSGYTTGPNAAIWPLAIHLVAGEFSGAPCGQYCDASTVTPTTIWPRADRYGPAGEFTGLVTYTHFSPRESGQVHQLNTESDYTGTTNNGIRTAHGHDNDDFSVWPAYDRVQMPNADSSACGGASNWDTLGRDTLSDATSCDLPNWFAYGFRGSVGVGTDWAQPFDALPGNGVDMPEPLGPARASCGMSMQLARPSCTGADNRIGDWIETVPGDLSPLMASQMQAFVAKYGRVVPNSATAVSPMPGAPLFGKAAVVFIPLWDCAEKFDPAASGAARWQSIAPGGDCSQLGAFGGQTVDRIHIVGTVPFTFYEGLIATSPVSVRAFWGNAFGDAGICSDDPTASGCGLNLMLNSAFLVPDE